MTFLFGWPYDIITWAGHLVYKGEVRNEQDRVLTASLS